MGRYVLKCTLTTPHVEFLSAGDRRGIAAVDRDEPNKPVRVRHRQRLQQDCVHDREHGGARADTERKGGERRDEEAGRSTETSNREPDVARDIVAPADDEDLPALFSDLRYPSELEVR